MKCKENLIRENEFLREALAKSRKLILDQFWWLSTSKCRKS